MADLAQDKVEPKETVERVGAQTDWASSAADTAWLRSALSPAPVVDSKLPKNLDTSATRASDATIALPTLHLNDDKVNVSDSYSVNSDVAKTYLNNRMAVVRILTVDPKVDATFSSSSGSGSIIEASGLVATGYHVVKNAAALHVKTDDGKIYEATLVDADASKDQAILQIKPDSPFATFRPVTLAKDSSESERHQMLALGYPRQVQDMHVSNLSFSERTSLDRLKVTGGLLPGEDPRRALIAALGPVFKGNSGGPVFDSVTGKQVGIVNMSATNETYITPIEDFQKFLSQVQSKYKSPDILGRKSYTPTTFTPSWELKK